MTDVVPAVGGPVPGPDGLLRCPWGATGPEDYRTYHDSEWGVAVHGDDLLFERLCLEAFQSGLSWLTILRRREGFRTAFADFSITRVATFDDADRARLLADAGIIRNRAKIDAAIANAQAAQALQGGLDALIWSFAPPRRRKAPKALSDVPAITEESTALAKELKRKGFRFVGPTTAYAMMQACGLVNDHLKGCISR